MSMLLDLIDVFAGKGALSGNPLAVVRGGEHLSAEAMLALTRWLGFSETTFLLPPTAAGADYRVRIFYPAGELPFAGHPTLGSAHAWLAAGGAPAREGVVVQQCEAGLIEVRQGEGSLAFRAPALRRSGPLGDVEAAEAARIAGVPAEAVVEAIHADNGPPWRLLRLRSAADVLAARPVARVEAHTDLGLIGPHPFGGPADWEVRAFFTKPGGALAEDPVTGSLNAAAALHLFGAGLARDSYVAGQGRVIGADGRVEARHDSEGAVWIGGRVAMVAAGASLGG
ncbi:MAG: PhzF family phenazine biosynthesis protein [Proteobacteria bacterium]|nr:PhzF family phenazine biosynthesis protein [Pseudomonadota bacterium]